MQCRKNTGNSTGFIDVFLQILNLSATKYGRFYAISGGKKQLKDEHKMCAKKCLTLPSYRLARKMQERARRTTFNDLNLHKASKWQWRTETKKLKERGEHAREILHRMEEEKKAKTQHCNGKN